MTRLYVLATPNGQYAGPDPAALERLADDEDDLLADLALEQRHRFLTLVEQALRRRGPAAPRPAPPPCAVCAREDVDEIDRRRGSVWADARRLGVHVGVVQRHRGHRRSGVPRLR